MSDDTRTLMHPDDIAHQLVTADNESVRVFLGDTIRVPLDPITEQGGVTTTDVDVEYFDAKVRFVDIVDGGETLHTRFHLTEDEWERLRLHEHWDRDPAESWRGERIIESWATRANNYGDYDPDEYESPVPDDSPTVSAIRNSGFDIDSPPAPFDPPTLEFNAVTAESVTDYGKAWTQWDLGTVQAVVRLEATSISPDRRDEEDPRDIDLSGLSRPDRPDIDFENLEPLEASPDLLEAVHTINRHAKRLDDEADEKYAQDQGAEARVASVRKSALYAAKTVAIHRFLRADETGVEVSKQSLNGDVEMYLFDFGAYSFHQPLDAVDDAVFEAVDGADPDEIATEIEFSPSAETETLSVTLDEAVRRLTDAGVDPNEYLRTTRVQDFDRGYTIGTEFRD